MSVLTKKKIKRKGNFVHVVLSNYSIKYISKSVSLQ